MAHVHGTGSSSSSAEEVMMIPYFHFSGGDNLWFSAWRPTSPGAIGGACVGVFFLAILDRFLSAVRSACEVRWHQRALPLSVAGSHAHDKSSSQTVDADAGNMKADMLKESRYTESPHRNRAPHTIFPFIPTHDIPRGMLHSVQVLLGYVLMLAVMTFNMSYIISIIVGLGVGEMLFGRVGARMTGEH